MEDRGLLYGDRIEPTMRISGLAKVTFLQVCHGRLFGKSHETEKEGAHVGKKRRGDDDDDFK